MKFAKLSNVICILFVIFASHCNSDDMKLLFDEPVALRTEWIEIVNNNFDDDDPAGWVANNGSPSPIDISQDCALAMSKMLGPFADPALEPNKETMQTFDLSAYPHSEVLVAFDLVIMESWDEEFAIVEIDNIVEFSSSYNKFNAPGINICNTDEENEWNDFGPQRIEIQVPHTGNTLKVHFKSTLNQLGSNGEPTDEWFGVDNFSISIR